MDFLANLLNNTGAFLAVFAGFCFLIFVHELGHYWAAKLSGVKVEQFAIGMGTAAFSWRKGIGFRWGSSQDEYDKRVREHILKQLQAADKHDTTLISDLKPSSATIDKAATELGLGECEYRVAWLPLGGYVKMLGQEDGKPEAVSDDPRSYNKASGKARAFILVAGVTMNLITGIMMFIIAFLAGVAFPPARIGEVVKGSPAAQAIALGHESDEALKGFKAGDKIISFNGEPIGDFNDFAVRVALTKAGTSAKVVIERENPDGTTQTLEYRVTPEAKGASGLLAVGIAPPASLKLDKDSNLSPDLKAAGVKPEMTITAVDGKPITRIDQLRRLVDQADGKPTTLTFDLIGKDPQNTAKSTNPVQVSLSPIPTLLPIDPEKDTTPNYLGLIPLIRVDNIEKGSPAQLGGLQPGDLIIQAGSHSWPRYEDFVDTVKNAKNTPVDITVERDGQSVKLAPMTPRGGRIGIFMGQGFQTNIVAGQTGSVAFGTLNVPSGSRIVNVAGHNVENFGQLQSALIAAVRKNAPVAASDAASLDAGTPATSAPAASAASAASSEKPLTIPVEYKSNIVNTPVVKGEITLSPELQSRLLAADWNLPIDASLVPLLVPVSAADPVSATVLGFKKTHMFVLQTYVTIQRLFERSVPISEARGPVGIVSAGTQIYKQGWTYYLFFMALISVNLVVMNMLPIPILDGGQLVFLAIEKIKGSPVSIEIQTVATYIGLGLLGCLMLTTLYFDIVRLFN
jgi:regulator of sigma E protease